MTRMNLSWRSEDVDGSIQTTGDHMLPVQFAELLRRSTQRAPEQRLMAAVLVDAIRELCESAGVQTTSAQRILGETSEWFESSDVSWPFSFENICDALRLDSAWIRGLLGRWLASHARSAQRPAKIPFIRRVAGSRNRITGDARRLRSAAPVAC